VKRLPSQFLKDRSSNSTWLGCTIIVRIFCQPFLSRNVRTDVIYSKARYWEDPHAFKPERFLKDWPRDAFLPFSAGARACIGRKSVISPSCNIIRIAHLANNTNCTGSLRQRVLQFSQCSCLSIKSQSRRNPNSLQRRLSRGNPDFWTVFQSSHWRTFFCLTALSQPNLTMVITDRIVFRWYSRVGPDETSLFLAGVDHPGWVPNMILSQQIPV